MTKVTYKERRFTSAFVAECKEQNQSPESDCDRAPQIEGVLTCPESRRPKKKFQGRGMTPHFISSDPAPFFSEPKRVTRNQLDGLNRNAVHIDETGTLKEGPKKVSGFGQLRDLLGKD